MPERASPHEPLAFAFMRAVEEPEKAEEFRIQEHYRELERFVKSLKKDELQRRLLEAMIELEKRENRYW